MSITPYLYYEDLDAAVKWLAKAFGFKRFGPRMPNHAAMKLGDSEVMMGAPGAKYKNPKRLGQATQSLYVMVDDVTRQFARARKAGAKVLEEPKQTEYGHLRFGVTDPEGHQWYFAQEVKATSRSRASSGSSASRT